MVASILLDTDRSIRQTMNGSDAKDLAINYSLFELRARDNESDVDGRLVVAKPGYNEPFVRAMCAFVVDERDSDREYCLVTLGPFGNEGADIPRVYWAHDVRDSPILYVELGICFSPSVEPEHLERRQEVNARDLFGRVVFSGEQTFLGVRGANPNERVAWMLNIETGQLHHPGNNISGQSIVGGEGLVSSRWSLISRDTGAPISGIYPYNAPGNQ